MYGLKQSLVLKRSAVGVWQRGTSGRRRQGCAGLGMVASAGHRLLEKGQKREKQCCAHQGQ